MDKNKSLKDLVNSFLSPEQKETFAKAFKFDAPIVPVITPVDNAEPPMTEAPIGEVKAKDGTVIKYSTPTPIVGETLVVVVTPEGEMPPPDGEIELENGDVLTVLGGVLTELETAEVPLDAPATTPAVTQEAMDAAVNDVTAKLEIANKTISALVARFDAVEKDNLELKTSLSTFSKAFNDLLNVPMGNPIVAPENKFSKTDKMFNKLGLNK